MTTIAAKNLVFYYSGTIRDKLTAARRLFRQHGQRLLQEQKILDALARLQKGEAALNKQMQAMDMGIRCRACAAGTGGGCCSSYMAENTDAILLLINLLLGIEIRRQHNNDIDCCYLGSQGCIFIIKPIFCLNYNCSHIRKAALKDEMFNLTKLTAVLLGGQTDLEGSILKHLKQKNL
jgi:hypothetical protein